MGLRDPSRQACKLPSVRGCEKPHGPKPPNRRSEFGMPGLPRFSARRLDSQRCESMQDRERSGVGDDQQADTKREIDSEGQHAPREGRFHG